MTTQAKTRMETRVDVGRKIETGVGLETSKYTVRVIGALSALIGIWGLACLIGGLASSGFGGLLQGYVTAVTGM